MVESSESLSDKTQGDGGPSHSIVFHLFVYSKKTENSEVLSSGVPLTLSMSACILNLRINNSLSFFRVRSNVSLKGRHPLPSPIFSPRVPTLPLVTLPGKGRREWVSSQSTLPP